MTVTTVLGRYALRRRLAAERVAGRHLRSTLIVGDAAAALDVAHRIDEDPAPRG